MPSPAETNTVHITQSPALTIAKTVSTTSRGTYTESVTISSTGPVYYLSLAIKSGNFRFFGPVTVTDDNYTLSLHDALPILGNLDAFLDPGESVTCTGSYSVTQTDLNAGTDIVNTAAGHATFGANAVDSPRSEERRVGKECRSLTIAKTYYTTTGGTYTEAATVTSTG